MYVVNIEDNVYKVTMTVMFNDITHATKSVH